ncbi:MAG TPA: RES family NAD+ phosphorylase [Limnobacter sp.]|nr:RES family NAD+ phosphorylase [Limnobacter sp.]
MPEKFQLSPEDLKPIHVLCHRMVESQESVATNEIVDTLEEQALLEELLEQSKPRLPKATSGLHYLLAAPFRYPPLKWGSRFGSFSERGIFYSSLETTTMLHEVAYYRFVLLDGLHTPLPKPLKSQHTEFMVDLQTNRAVLLNDRKFGAFQMQLRHPSDYSFSQQAGAQMRALNVQAFLFHSARDPDHGINAGVFDPACFTGQEPRGGKEWFCQLESSTEVIHFYCPSTRQSEKFEASLYRANGILPKPAAGAGTKA